MLLLLLLLQMLLLLQLQLLLLLHLQAQLDSDRLDWFSTTSAGQLPSFSLLLRNERKKKETGNTFGWLKNSWPKGYFVQQQRQQLFSAREPVRAARCSC